MHRTWRAATAVAVLLATGALTATPSASAAPAWLAQPDLSATGEPASTPAVAMNGAGDAIVSWQRAVAGPVHVSLRPAGGAFSAPLELGGSGFDVFGVPQSAIDDDGDAVVVWQGHEGLDPDVLLRVATRPAGGSFGPPLTLSAQDGASLVHPQVATNAAGDTVVAWTRAAGQSIVVQAVVRPAGGTFSEPAELSEPASLITPPRVAIDAAGRATVVWAQITAETHTVQAATRPAGGPFAATVDLTAAAQVGSFPGPGAVGGVDVATNAAGDAVAVWTRQDDAGNGIVQAASRPAGAAAFAPYADVSVAGRNADSPQVAVDGAGNAVAVWMRNDGTSFVAQAASRPAGGSFGAPVDLSLAGGEGWAPQVALNPAGDAVVAWRRSNGTNTIVQAAVRRAGAAAFAPTTDLSPAGRDATDPQIGVDAHGDALVAWRRSNGTNTIVQAAGYDGSGPQLRGLSVASAVTVATAATYALSPLDVWSPVTSTVWSFDDGHTATGASVSHAFATAGTHGVTVTATDALGNTTSATRAVQVTSPASPPPSGPGTETPSPSPSPPPPPAATPPPPPPPPPTCANCGLGLARLGSSIDYAASITRRHTTITNLVIRPAHAGTSVRLACTGRGCPFTSRTRTVVRETRRLSLSKLLRSAKLRRGAELQIRVTKPATIGTMATLVVRDRKQPRRISRCLFPGAAKPAACPR